MQLIKVEYTVRVVQCSSKIDLYLCSCCFCLRLCQLLNGCSVSLIFDTLWIKSNLVMSVCNEAATNLLSGSSTLPSKRSCIINFRKRQKKKRFRNFKLIWAFSLMSRKKYCILRQKKKFWNKFMITSRDVLGPSPQQVRPWPWPWPRKILISLAMALHHFCWGWQSVTMVTAAHNVASMKLIITAVGETRAKN